MVMNKEDHGPECECCKHGPEKARQFEKECMEKYGWYAHFVFDAPNSTGNCFHTHGLTKTYEHKDIQFIVPVPQQIAQGVLSAAVELIKNGTALEPGKEYEGILKGYKVRAERAIENDREVVRLILPDRDGNLDKDKIDEQFAKQYEGVIYGEQNQAT